MDSATRRRTGRTAVLVLIVLVALAGVAFFITAGAIGELARRDSDGVFAEVRIRPAQQLLIDAGAESRFEVYRQTHARLITANFVLQSALREPRIAELDLIQRQPRPIDWLAKSLVVSSPGSEFLRISLPGHRSAEAAAIVNAVVEAYMREVVRNEGESRRIRMTELEKLASGVAREIDRLKNDRRRQRELSAVPLLPKIELLDVDLMRKEYTRLRLKRIELNAAVFPDRASREAEPNEAAAESDLQRGELETVERQIEAFESEFGALADGRVALSKSQIALDEIDPEIATKEKILEQLREQIERMKIELNAPIGIDVFRKATAIE